MGNILQNREMETKFKPESVNTELIKKWLGHGDQVKIADEFSVTRQVVNKVLMNKIQNDSILRRAIAIAMDRKNRHEAIQVKLQTLAS